MYPAPPMTRTTTRFLSSMFCDRFLMCRQQYFSRFVSVVHFIAKGGSDRQEEITIVHRKSRLPSRMGRIRVSAWETALLVRWFSFTPPKSVSYLEIPTDHPHARPAHIAKNCTLSAAPVAGSLLTFSGPEV